MGYHEQLERARRWLDRVENASTGPHSSSDINSPAGFKQFSEYEDYLYALFQNCWHVKDWILSDPSAPTKLKEAVKKVDKEGVIDSLMLCSDIANGSKHVSGPKPSRTTRRGATPLVEVEIEISPEAQSVTSWTYKVADNDGQSYEVIELARQALEEWETIIRENVEPWRAQESIQD
jgi:hypothetical protein